MSHVTESRLPTPEVVSPQSSDECPVFLSAALAEHAKREKLTILTSIQVLALSHIPVYVQTDGYRWRAPRIMPLSTAQEAEVRRLDERRKRSVLDRNVPLEIILAMNVVRCIPKEEQFIQRKLLVDYNEDPTLDCTIRCVDLDADIHLDPWNYESVRSGTFETVYTCGRGHEAFYDHGDEQVDAFKRLYAEIGERALSVEDSNAYLEDITLMPMASYEV